MDSTEYVRGIYDSNGHSIDSMILQLQSSEKAENQRRLGSLIHVFISLLMGGGPCVYNYMSMTLCLEN